MMTKVCHGLIESQKSIEKASLVDLLELGIEKAFFSGKETGQDFGGGDISR